MEVMVVVAIIGASAALAAPALSEAMAVRRAGEASHMLVRIGARGRSEAMGYGRAHLLVYTDTSTGPGANFGSVELWRGRVDRCAFNDWGTIVTGACAANQNCVDRLDMGYYAYPTNRVRMRLTGASAGNVCFQPDGEMLYAAPGGTFAPNPPAGQEAIQFTLQRLVGTAPSGVQRTVVFPFGAAPRILR